MSKIKNRNIKTLMIFAAGKGSRMKHLTHNTHKSLLTIGNISIISRVLNFVIKYDHFESIVINTHYMHELVLDEINKFIKYNTKNLPKINVIYESEILETGGAIKNAYKYFDNNEAIFTLNSDSFLESYNNPFQTMEQMWQPDRMDFLLMLQSKNEVIGQFASDFDMNGQGKVIYEKTHNLKPYTYTGLQIMKPLLAYEYPAQHFKIMEIIKNSRVYGIKNKGIFYHANTPEHLEEIAQYLVKADTAS